MESKTESIWVEIQLHSQRIILAVVYRPPSDDDFYQNFQSYLEKVWQKRKHIFLMGDFNSDMLFRGKSANECSKGKQLLRLINCFRMKNMIKAPTRITQETESLIDLFISTSEEKVTKSGESLI